MDTIFEKAQAFYDEQRPFVIFSTPGSNHAVAYFQEDSTHYRFEEDLGECFLFHPYDPSEAGLAIPKKHSEILTGTIEFRTIDIKTIPFSFHEEEKQAYGWLVQQALDLIHKKRAAKIVTSRRKTVALSHMDLKQLAEDLLASYYNAFRYVWYHPKTGLWCGATPELLLQTEGGNFKTMALAGTKQSDQLGKVEWSEKEREEQQLVVDDIVSKLQQVLSVIKISKTINHIAGPVVHLRTDIVGVIKKGKSSLFQIAETLHPTPAICGTPRDVAHKFILEKEPYDREFYAGYLGPKNDASKSSSLFVNLRCMKVEEGKAHIYVGGGITQGSIPEAEWEETQNKMQTMLRILQPFL